MVPEGLLGVDLVRPCNFSDDTGPGRDTHLDHDQPQKRLDSVGTDVHPVCNFLAGQTLKKQSHRRMFARRQTETQTDLIQLHTSIRIPFQQQHERGTIWYMGIAVEIQREGTTMIRSSRGFELLHELEGSRRTLIKQAAADSLCEPALEVANLLGMVWECEYLDGLDIRGD